MVVIIGALAVAGSFLKYCKSMGKIVPSNTPAVIEQHKENATINPKYGVEC